MRNSSPRERQEPTSTKSRQVALTANSRKSQEPLPATAPEALKFSANNLRKRLDKRAPMCYNKDNEREVKKMCDTCEAKGTCPFYESGAEECVYDELVRMKKEREGQK